MILAALKAKLRERGALGFAADAAELATACLVIGFHSLALAAVAAVAAAGAVAAAPVLAADLLTRHGPINGCRNAEEPSCDS